MCARYYFLKVMSCELSEHASHWVQRRFLDLSLVNLINLKFHYRGIPEQAPGYLLLWRFCIGGLSEIESLASHIRNIRWVVRRVPAKVQFKQRELPASDGLWRGFTVGPDDVCCA